LAALARESQINKMGPDNISVVFAPTLMKMEITDPMQALQEVKVSQKVLKAVLLKRMERHLSIQFASNHMARGMNTRLGKVVR
jgi:type III secretory pathway lipoprotein EscJ